MTSIAVREARSAAPARILLVHERYRERGGEDVTFETEAGILERRGHVVERLEFDNREIPDRLTVLDRGRLALGTVASRAGVRAVREAARRVRPDVVHVHNWFPLASPAILAAARDSAAVVVTLHNYRLVCPSATLFRDGAPCTDCVGRVPLPGVVHACYRDSHAQSAVVAAMLVTHRLAGTWRRHVDRFVVPTAFARDALAGAGLPSERVEVKPHSVDPDPGVAPLPDGISFAYAGRLTEDKGTRLLLDAWSLLDDAPPLAVLGDGPLRDDVAVAAAGRKAIRYDGGLDRAGAIEGLRRSAVTIVPSLLFETFGMTIAESFALGRPVIAPAHGAPAELVEPGRTGWLFAPGDPADLARVVADAVSARAEVARMGAIARETYERRFSDEAGYRALMAVYQAAHRTRWQR